MQIGQFRRQPGNYQAFIPNSFPPKEVLILPIQTQLLLDQATAAVSKLDGITQLLPNLDFYILMYFRKEAKLSSEIEGTKATLAEVIKSEADISNDKPQDTARIFKYVEAMRYGLNRLDTLPLSLRFIKEVHKVLLEDTADALGKTPGEFRTSQNWIGGPTVNTARFVPPPPIEMRQALADFEKFLHLEGIYQPLVKAALAHAQFEVIHPFLDGNGRTGRLLTSFFLCKMGVLESPVLYLSEYFMSHRESYYESLDDYHTKTDGAIRWLNFFFVGVAEISTKAIQIVKKINEVALEDIYLVQKLKQSAESASKVVRRLYELPYFTSRNVQEWLKISAPAANALIQKMLNVGLIGQEDASSTYDRVYLHDRYFKLFLG